MLLVSLHNDWWLILILICFYFFSIVIRILILLPNFPRPTLNNRVISSESINSSKLHLISCLSAFSNTKKIMWCKKHKTPTSFQRKIRLVASIHHPDDMYTCIMGSKALWNRKRISICIFFTITILENFSSL